MTLRWMGGVCRVPGIRFCSNFPDCVITRLGRRYNSRDDKGHRRHSSVRCWCELAQILRKQTLEVCGDDARARHGVRMGCA